MSHESTEIANRFLLRTRFSSAVLLLVRWRWRGSGLSVVSLVFLAIDPLPRPFALKAAALREGFGELAVLGDLGREVFRRIVGGRRLALSFASQLAWC